MRARVLFHTRMYRTIAGRVFAISRCATYSDAEKHDGRRRPGTADDMSSGAARARQSSSFRRGSSEHTTTTRVGLTTACDLSVAFRRNPNARTQTHTPRLTQPISSARSLWVCTEKHLFSVRTTEAYRTDFTTSKCFSNRYNLRGSFGTRLQKAPVSLLLRNRRLVLCEFPVSS